MTISSAISGVSAVASLLLLAAPAAAQTPDSASTRPQGTLIKLGTGITPGLEWSGYRGFSFPLVLGAEHHLTPEISLYANAFSGFHVGRRNRFFDSSLDHVIGDYGFDAGIRYYYNQEKRRQKGRATGPFVGNYVALQTSSVFSRTPYQHVYDYSALMLAWGMQRRLGKYGWLDAYVGLGFGREQQYLYHHTGGPGVTPTGGSFVIKPELGIKFSLGSRLTH